MSFEYQSNPVLVCFAGDVHSCLSLSHIFIQRHFNLFLALPSLASYFKSSVLNRFSDTEKRAQYIEEERIMREENIRLQRKLQREVERREALCRQLSESESSLEMDDERYRDSNHTTSSSGLHVSLCMTSCSMKSVCHRGSKQIRQMIFEMCLHRSAVNTQLNSAVLWPQKWELGNTVQLHAHRL